MTATTMAVTPVPLPASSSPLARKQALSAFQQQPLSLDRTERGVWAKVLVAARIACYASVALITSYTVGMSHNAIVALSIFMLFVVIGYCSFPSHAYQWFVATKRYELYTRALRRADIREEPVVGKTTESGENASLEYGFSCMQGWRRTMEDDHTLLLLDEGGFFGIYDGHSGAGAAKFCGANMFRFVADTEAFAQGKIRQAFYDGFIAVDRHLHAVEDETRERSGCTAVVLYVKDDVLYCANAGDSRCVLCRNGKAEPMSVDHKPFLPSEQTRIERAGGYVLNRRVNGILALSRAIGDFAFKANPDVPWDQQAVTSSPEVRTLRLNRDKDEFAVVACDGIWDVLTNEEVVDFVRPRIQQRVALAKIAEDLMDKCLSAQPFGLGCDNMSVVIVKFKRRAQRQSITDAVLLNSPLEQPVSPLCSNGTNGGEGVTATKMETTPPADDAGPRPAGQQDESLESLLPPAAVDGCDDAVTDARLRERAASMPSLGPKTPKLAPEAGPQAHAVSLYACGAQAQGEESRTRSRGNGLVRCQRVAPGVVRSGSPDPTASMAEEAETTEKDRLLTAPSGDVSCVVAARTNAQVDHLSRPLAEVLGEGGEHYHHSSRADVASGTGSGKLTSRSMSGTESSTWHRVSSSRPELDKLRDAISCGLNK